MCKEIKLRSKINNSALKLLIIGAYCFIFFGILPLFFIYQGYLLDSIFNVPKLGKNFTIYGIIFLTTGLIYMLFSMISLTRRGDGLPISHLPPKTLVRKGVYKISRHPIYIGYNLAFVGVGFLAKSFSISFISGTHLFISWILYATKFEESRLVTRFGDQYKNYIEEIPLLPFRIERIGTKFITVISVPLTAIAQKFANKTVLFRYKRTIWVNWGFIIALGSIFSLLVSINLLSSGGFSTRMLYTYYIGITITLLFFGRFFWLIYQGKSFFTDFWKMNKMVGFVSYGSYFGVFVFIYFYSKYYSVDILWLLDRTLIPTILLSSIGRIGCLTYGCCHGKYSSSGIVYSDPNSKIMRVRGKDGNTPIYPTQIYSSLSALMILLLVIFVSKSGLPDGGISIIILFSYSVLRFVLEYFRDQKTYTSANITSGQIGSLVIYLVAFLLMIFVSNQPSGYEVHLTFSSLFTIPEPINLIIPIFVITPLLIFIVCGLHIENVGSW